jgi:hypothetical protein
MTSNVDITKLKLDVENSLGLKPGSIDQSVFESRVSSIKLQWKRDSYPGDYSELVRGVAQEYVKYSH